jgi:hypothetical protein
MNVEVVCSRRGGRGRACWIYGKRAPLEALLLHGYVHNAQSLCAAGLMGVVKLNFCLFEPNKTNMIDLPVIVIVTKETSTKIGIATIGHVARKVENNKTHIRQQARR